MKKTWLAAIAVASGLSTTSAARADNFEFSFAGAGVSGTIQLTYGAATDATYPDALVVTGITGTFTDTNINIVDASVGPIVPRNFAQPEPGNMAAPDSFSHFAVASGLPADNHGFISYDDLYWPNGSPPTATDYTAHGGFLDIYGLLFDIGGGKVVNLWSNGDFGAGPDYGVAVVTSAQALDYVGGVQVPEPASMVLLGAGIAALGFVRRRAA